MKGWVFLILFFLFSVPTNSKSFSIPEITLPLIKKIPVIDGNIDEKEWGDAARIIGFMKSPTDIEERI
ncbi:hypothetical protein J7L87_06075, partial [bacterium]|nr:hypothetical protein [bacterium]